MNTRFMGSSKAWHADDGIWWSCLSIDIEILDHPDVWFCTGNNAYSVTQRAQNLEGFDALFAEAVPWGMYGSVARRHVSTPANHTTDPQAEVLYPRALDLAFLRGIYVTDPEFTDAAAGIIAAIDGSSPIELSAIPVSARPDIFQ